jgi:hypothetical protein
VAYSLLFAFKRSTRMDFKVVRSLPSGSWAAAARRPAGRGRLEEPQRVVPKVRSPSRQLDDLRGNRFSRPLRLVRRPRFEQTASKALCMSSIKSLENSLT